MQYFSIPYQVFHNGNLILEDVKAIKAMPSSLPMDVDTMKMNIKRKYAEKMQGKRVDVFVSPDAIEQVNKDYYDTLQINERAEIGYTVALPQSKYELLSKGIAG